jgi:hypothetical protein
VFWNFAPLRWAGGAVFWRFVPLPWARGVVHWRFAPLPQASGVVGRFAKPLSRTGGVVSRFATRLRLFRGVVSGGWKGAVPSVAPVFGGGTPLFSSGRPLAAIVAVAGSHKGAVGRAATRPRWLLARCSRAIPERQFPGQPVGDLIQHVGDQNAGATGADARTTPILSFPRPNQPSPSPGEGTLRPAERWRTERVKKAPPPSSRRRTVWERGVAEARNQNYEGWYNLPAPGPETVPRKL